MRVALNYFIPVLQDPISDENLNTGKICTNIISNGYYGYQSITINKSKVQENFINVNAEQSQDVMFTVLHEDKVAQNIGEQRNRKRAWEWNERGDNKRRRENEYYESFNNQSTTHLHMKPPTHNVPDIPRCITGHYI